MRTWFERIPALTAIIAQIIAGLIVSTIADPGWSPYLWFALHGILAAFLTVLVGGSRWWIPFQCAVPFAIHGALLLALPPWIWLSVVLVLFLVYGGGIVTRVPLYLSNMAACVALADLIRELPAPQAVDLGAGFGGPMRHLGAIFPTGSFTSVEASPLTCLGAWFLAWGSPGRVRVRWGDLWGEPLGRYDLVYVFLSPAPMPKLWDKVQAELRPGAILVSNTFPVPGVTPERIIDLPGRADARLYVYRR